MQKSIKSHICFKYSCLIKGKNELTVNIRKTLSEFKLKQIEETGEIFQEKASINLLRLYIAVPVLLIAVAELLIFLGRIESGILVHSGIILSLLLSYILIKDTNVYNIYMQLMLLPILRILSLTIPVLFNNAIYTFVFVYSPLAIPVVAIIIHQKMSLKEIGITTRNFLVYIAISIPLGFLVGLGEYLTIRPGYLISDLTFGNFLKLTIIMVFFVSLVEELIYRSFLQIRLEQLLSKQESLLITSLLYGVMHSGYGNFNEILYISFAGFFIGLVFYKTKSLPFATAIHGFANLFLFGILPLYVIGLA